MFLSKKKNRFHKSLKTASAVFFAADLHKQCRGRPLCRPECCDFCGGMRASRPTPQPRIRVGADNIRPNAIFMFVASQPPHQSLRDSFSSRRSQPDFELCTRGAFGTLRSPSPTNLIQPHRPYKNKQSELRMQFGLLFYAKISSNSTPRISLISLISSG